MKIIYVCVSYILSRLYDQKIKFTLTCVLSKRSYHKKFEKTGNGTIRCSTETF